MTENYHIKLKEQTAKALIEKIKLNMNAKAPFKARNASYQNPLWKRQALANFVIGRSKAFSFDVPALAIRRNDDLDIQHRISTVTLVGRKALNINKSTLWYQRKKLAECKTIKVYNKVLSKPRER